MNEEQGWLTHDRRVLLMALGAGLPAISLATYFSWTQLPLRASVPLIAVVVAVWLQLSFSLRRVVVRPLATLSNLIAGVREGDFSFRARGARDDDPLGLTLREINSLADTLREQRLGAMEANALLRKIMGEIDVIVLAFDGRQRLVLANAAGERLLDAPVERLVGRSASRLGLEACFEGEDQRAEEIELAGSIRRWEIKRSAFRQGGRPMTLVVISDLSRVLHEEERQAWRRLIRVLSHEINNSLAPISSIAGSLERLLGQDPLPSDWRSDAHEGLTVVQNRAAGLSRFMAAYAQLSRLPPPVFAPVDVAELVRHAAALETRVPVKVEAAAEVELEADRAQLEQVLINVLRNAAEAALEAHGEPGAKPGPEVAVGWSVRGDRLRLWIHDNGPGVASTANLFVPFFSTKADGSGIGLALSRHIVEAHGGSIALRDRTDAEGAELVMELPLQRVGSRPSQFGFVPNSSASAAPDSNN
jgi:nitrogen fixation/metabolism regulation signal transduction histidine kinase